MMDFAGGSAAETLPPPPKKNTGLGFDHYSEDEIPHAITKSLHAAA